MKKIALVINIIGLALVITILLFIKVNPVKTNTNLNGRTGITIDSYSYAISKDIERNISKLTITLDVSNEYEEPIIVDTIEPIFEERLIELLISNPRIECNKLNIGSGETSVVEGVFHFKQNGSSTLWVDEQLGLLQGYEIKLIVNKKYGY